MGVYKEGKNWKVQVYYRDWQGNRKRKQKRGFRTKGEAKEWERDFLQQQTQSVDIEFGNFLELYYKDMKVRLRENTMYTKRYIIDLKIKPYFEHKVLSEITVADIRNWQNELLKQNYSETYLKTINCQLGAIFNYAVRYYNLKDNHKKYIQEQESHDIAMNKLSVKEYEGPFKGCDESRALRLERSESQRL